MRRTQARNSSAGWPTPWPSETRVGETTGRLFPPRPCGPFLAGIESGQSRAHLPISLLPCELEHPLTASEWALACLRLNAGTLAETDPYGGSEIGILNDQVWFAHYLVALARLTPEGRQIVDVARGQAS